MDIWCPALSRFTGRLALLSVWPFAHGAVHAPRSPALLWPLLTARAGPMSAGPRHPFSREASSPQVRLDGCPCTSAGSTGAPLDRESFAVKCPLAPVRPASYPIPVRRPAGLAPRCFQRVAHASRLAVHSGRCDQLPRRTFTSQVIGHAGHHKERAAAQWTSCVRQQQRPVRWPETTSRKADAEMRFGHVLPQHPGLRDTTASGRRRRASRQTRRDPSPAGVQRTPADWRARAC